MRKIMLMAVAAACALALMGCGGDGDDNDSTSTRADEGIWGYTSGADQSGGQTVAQTVILSDGSFWGIYGYSSVGGTCFQINDVLQGTASVSGNNASGTYMDFGTALVTNNTTPINGTYTGTVSAQNNINLTFNNGLTNVPTDMGALANINMSYDSIYNQSASLSSIAGNYQQAVNGCVSAGGPFPIYNLSISGSNLSLVQSYIGSTDVVMTGTITPHGSTVNVFDISLTAASVPATSSGAEWWVIPARTTYKGILFQTSGILKNDVELVATSGNNVLFYLETKN